MASSPSGLENSFLTDPVPTEPIETAHRRIVTPLPAPPSIARLRQAAKVFPQVNCYQPPIIWDRAEGYQIFDAYGNCWIDFSSTAVTTNIGHGHPEVRAAIAKHAAAGLLAQFSFASDIRIELAERLLEIIPGGYEKVYFWTVGSEANEAAFRLARQHGLRSSPSKSRILVLQGDYHGWTLGAHQLSGQTSIKPWLPQPDPGILHAARPDATQSTSLAWSDSLAQLHLHPEEVAGVFVEPVQGWQALPLPVTFVQELRTWTTSHNAFLIFDEVQTGFCRTGRWFAFEHYDVLPDLLCLGKGLTSSLPLAALVGSAEILDQILPGEVTTTHAAHPISCAAALANLDVMCREQLAAEAHRKGEVADRELQALQQRFPRVVSRTTGMGLLRAIHLQDPVSGMPSRELARDITWGAVRRGVMLFQVNQPTIKICPPLMIPDDALIEGIRTIGECLQAICP